MDGNSELAYSLNGKRANERADVLCVGLPRHNKGETLLAEGCDRGCFVVFYVEHGVQLCDLQQVVDLLGQV